MRKFLLLSALSGVFLLMTGRVAGSEELRGSVYAIKDCRIVTMAGPEIVKGNVVIRDGLIVAASAQAAIPADAEVMDGTNLTVYPGLIDALSQSLLKMPEKKIDRLKYYTGEFTDEDLGITPDIHAFDHFSIDKGNLEKHHAHGFTAANVLPVKGMLSGQSAVFSLKSTEKNKNVLLRDNWLGVSFEAAGLFAYPNSLMGSVAYLRQKFLDTARYDLIRNRWSVQPKGITRIPYNPVDETLRDFSTARKKILFLCRNQHDILRALELGKELKLDFLICDRGGEGFRVISELKKAGARLIVPLSYKIPATSIYSQQEREKKEKAEKEIYPKNPARLAEAGIPFVLSSLDTDDPKSFMQGIQKAIENGLPREKALEMLTRGAALFLEIEKAMGTIEAGKIANIVVSDGDLLTKEAKIKFVFTDGIRFEIKDPKAAAGEKPAVNVSGKWEINIEGAGLKVEAELVQEEGALAGKLSLPFGVFDFTGGTVSAKEIYFEMTLSVGGQQIDLYFTATVEGDTMKGTVVQGTQGSMEFTAKRIPFGG